MRTVDGPAARRSDMLGAVNPFLVRLAAASAVLVFILFVLPRRWALVVLVLLGLAVGAIWWYVAQWDLEF